MSTLPPPNLLAFLATQPGRCVECGWHVQNHGGHHPECPTIETSGTDGQKVDRVLNQFIAARRPFSLNDIRGRLVNVGNRNIIGARVRAAKQAGRIVDTGRRVPSTDEATHGHEIKVWAAA